MHVNSCTKILSLYYVIQWLICYIEITVVFRNPHRTPQDNIWISQNNLVQIDYWETKSTSTNPTNRSKSIKIRKHVIIYSSVIIFKIKKRQINCYLFVFDHEEQDYKQHADMKVSTIGIRLQAIDNVTFWLKNKNVTLHEKKYYTYHETTQKPMLSSFI